MRIKNVVLALLLLVQGAQLAYGQGTPKPKSSLTSEITQQFQDQLTGAITPSILRGVLYDFVQSWQQYSGVNAQVGTSYTIQTSDYGQLVTFNNANPVAVTLPQVTGSFGTFNVFVSNKGLGTVTITPAGGSTINGGANISLSQGNGAWIVSDSVNYQALLFATGSAASPGTPTNTLNSQTVNYTIQTSDCGKTVQSGTGSTGYISVTLPAAGTVPSTCSVDITNGDTAHAKLLSGFPSNALTYLWPGQTINVGVVNGAWAVLKHPGRWLLTADINFYVGSGGSNSTTTDGMASGAPFLTAAYVYNTIVQKNIDLNGHNVFVNITTSLTAQVNTMVGPLVGAQCGGFGAGGFVVQGTVGNQNAIVMTVATNNFMFQGQSGACFQVQWLQFQGASGAGILLANSDSSIGFANVTFVANTGQASFGDTAGSRALIQSYGPFAIASGTGAVNIGFVSEDHSLIILNQALTLSGSPTWTTAFVQADLGGMIDGTGFTYSGGTPVGSRFLASSNGIIWVGGAGCAATFYPGNAAGSTGSGGICP